MSVLVPASICVALLAQVPASTPLLDVNLAMESQHIVVREPVKLVVEIKNVSDGPVPVVAIDELQSIHPMDHVLLQVRDESGRAVWRKYWGDATDCGIKNPHYSGVPLPPGGIIRFNFYPNVTHVVDPETEAVLGEEEPTFGHTGRYWIRAAYYIPPVYESLRAITGGLVISNELELDVEKPSRSDKRVLDAVWQGGGVAQDDFNRTGFAEDRLRKVILKEDQSRLLAYAQFSLARSLGCSRTSHEAVAILSQLAREAPGFRDEEVRVNLTWVALNLGERDLATQMMNELVVRRPELKNNYKVAQAYIVANTGDFQEFYDWVEQRNHGLSPDFTSMVNSK